MPTDEEDPDRKILFNCFGSGDIKHEKHERPCVPYFSSDETVCIGFLLELMQKAREDERRKCVDEDLHDEHPIHEKIVAKARAATAKEMLDDLCYDVHGVRVSILDENTERRLKKKYGVE